MEKTIIGNHIVTNVDPQLAHNEVEAFCFDKKIILKQYTTTTIPTQGGGLMVAVTCLIQWETTQAEFTTYRNRLKLMLKG